MSQPESRKDRLDKVLKLLAIQAVKDKPEEQEKIAHIGFLRFHARGDRWATRGEIESR
jgi:hypothetical protein